MIMKAGSFCNNHQIDVREQAVMVQLLETSLGILVLLSLVFMGNFYA